MLTKDALKFFGGSKTKLAAAVGVRPPAIYSWGEYVPEVRARALSDVSGGVLKYDKAIYDRLALTKSASRSALSGEILSVIPGEYTFCRHCKYRKCARENHSE